jgi:hypothetical protein
VGILPYQFGVDIAVTINPFVRAIAERQGIDDISVTLDGLARANAPDPFRLSCEYIDLHGVENRRIILHQETANQD